MVFAIHDAPAAGDHFTLGWQADPRYRDLLDYVMPYDGALIRTLKQHDILVQCHCHGKVRHAVKGMIEIRTRVEEILSHGSRRLILGASAGPISAITPQLAANYKAWIDAALAG